MTQPKNVEIYFDFESGEITISENFRSNNGIPMPVWHKRAKEIILANYAEITDQSAVDEMISTEQRQEFTELCVKYYSRDWDGSNYRGCWQGSPIEEFIIKLEKELTEEIEQAQLNNRPVNGIGFQVEAGDYLEKIHFIDSGLSAISTDKDCERISEELDNEALREYGWSLQDTEKLAIYWRDKMREEIEERIVYVLTNGADSTFREEYSDLDDALDAAMEIAREMVGNDSNLDQWGDDMATGWGVCPENDDGAFWPSVHAELDGKRIDKLPWKR